MKHFRSHLSPSLVAGTLNLWLSDLSWAPPLPLPHPTAGSGSATPLVANEPPEKMKLATLERPCRVGTKIAFLPSPDQRAISPVFTMHRGKL